MFKNLCDLLKTRVIHGKIINDGNCFFHALEYALGNCDLVANRQPLYERTRREVASFAIEKIRRQENKLLDEYKKIPRSDEELSQFYQSLEDRIAFLENFKTSKEFSNEDIIQYAALMKQKILCIVEEEGDHRMSMICPGVSFLKENIVFLLHSNGNHYETFQYPIHISNEMVETLKRLRAQVVSKEHIIKIKDFTLEHLMSSILSSRIKRRKTLNLRSSASSKRSIFKTRKNENRIRRIVQANQTKLLKEFEQIKKDEAMAIQLEYNLNPQSKPV